MSNGLGVDEFEQGLATETTQTAQSVLYGAVTETAPDSDTASSGLNGRLQRIAQRIASLITAITDGTQRAQITNGTNNADVTNTQPVSTDYGLAVRPIAVELPTYSVNVNGIAVGNNKSMLAIQNTGTSIVKIREIWIINDRTSSVTGAVGLFEARRIASFSGGTSAVPSPHDTSDSLPGTITASTGATVATETALLRSVSWSTDEWGPDSTNTENSDHATQQSTPFFNQPFNGKALTVRQSQGIHIKFATNSTAGTFSLRFVFTVE